MITFKIFHFSEKFTFWPFYKMWMLKITYFCVNFMSYGVLWAPVQSNSQATTNPVFWQWPLKSKTIDQMNDTRPSSLLPIPAHLPITGIDWWRIIIIMIMTIHAWGPLSFHIKFSTSMNHWSSEKSKQKNNNGRDSSVTNTK